MIYNVLSGQVSSGIVVSASDEMFVLAGGTAKKTAVSGYYDDIKDTWVYGNLEVGGVTSDTTVSSGRMYISSGGRASDTVMNGGELFLVEGGAVVGATVNIGGYFNIESGGSATAVRENGGYVLVDDGASVTFVPNSFRDTVLSCNSATLHSGTTAMQTTLKYEGELAVHNGGIADSTTLVTSESYLYVSSGGLANNTVISAGDAYVEEGGVVKNVVVSGGSGWLNVFSGGKATGTLRIADTGLVFFEAGGILDFDISALAPGGAALVDDYSLVDGAPDCTITVGKTQQDGNYVLAGKVADRFAATTFTVYTDAGTRAGTITVGGSLNVGRGKYTLGVSSDQLVLSLSSEKLTDSGKTEPGKDGSFTPKLSDSGRYTLTGVFGGKRGTVTVLDGKGKKVGAGTAKGGVIVFKKELLLDKNGSYTVVVKNTDRKGGPAEYEVKLEAQERFTKGDNSDDTLETAKPLAAGATVNDWVGYSDAVDCYKLGVDARGGIYDLDLSGVGNNVRLTVFSADGRKIKSVSASAKKPAVALANLCLADGSYAAVEAPKANKAQNSNYTLKLTEKAVFTGSGNNDWSEAVVLKEGDILTGALTKAPGGDSVDYCDVSTDGVLSFEMTSGKAKVSFFDEKCKAVKIDSVRMANGSLKTKVASLTLTENSGRADFSLAALGTFVKYMKIEASGKTLNGYTITNIA